MASQGRSLLLVDDEELNIDMLSRRLSRSGFEVEVATDGRAALAHIAARRFDLVLLDQMMPGMSGREVLERIREDHGPDTLPVIMVTALAESERVAEALEAGANDYVTKPIDFRVTLARIHSQLARCEAERALRISEERYALASRASRDAIWDWDLEAGTIFFSERWTEMLGLSPENVDNTPGSWFSRVSSPIARPWKPASAWRSPARAAPWTAITASSTPTAACAGCRPGPSSRATTRGRRPAFPARSPT